MLPAAFSSLTSSRIGMPPKPTQAGACRQFWPRRSGSIRRRNIRGAGRNTATAGCRWSSTRSRAECRAGARAARLRQRDSRPRPIAATSDRSRARRCAGRHRRGGTRARRAISPFISATIVGAASRSITWPNATIPLRPKSRRNSSSAPARSASAASRTSTGGSSMPRPALAHDLSARFGPVDERAAAAAAQHRGLCAE